MEERIRCLLHKLLQFLIALRLARWIVRNRVRDFVWLRIHDVATELYDLDEELDVERIREEAWVDDGWRERVRRADVD